MNRDRLFLLLYLAGILAATLVHDPAWLAAGLAVVLVMAGREAWRRGLLLADNLPLGQLIEELSRYRPGHLACDPAIAGLPVMGSFPLKDTDQALRLLEAALPIRVEKTMDWWVNVAPKA